VAASKGQLEVVKALVAAGADVHAKTANGKTAIDFAAKMHKTAVVEILLAAGAEIDPHALEKVSLWEASSHGYLQVLEILECRRQESERKNNSWVDNLAHRSIQWL
jgi:ankyrin repeat domain-containing protein 17